MKLAISLLRVSSDRQYQEGQGINVQKRTIDYFAERNEYAIVRYFVEHYSGRKADREVLEEIIEYLAKNEGEISALIVSQIDRFTRAGAEVYLYLQKQLRSLGVELVDASGIIQQPVNTLAHTGFSYEWSTRSPSRLTETIMAEQANAEATQILTRCIGGQIESAQKGFQYKSADYGFQNEKTVTSDGRKRTIMVKDETEAVHIEMMYTLRAEGHLSDTTICERLNNAGYESRPFRRYDKVTREVVGEGGRVKLTPKQLQKYIRRPVYCGIRIGKWTKRKAIWLPRECPRLVSIDVFNRANRGRIKITEVDNDLVIEENVGKQISTAETGDFLLRHVICCPECNKPFKASKSRGKSGGLFGYYHCSRDHKYFGVNAKVFEDTVAKTVRNIRFKKKLLGVLKEVVRDVWIKHHKADEIVKQQTKAHIEALRKRQTQLVGKISRCASDIVQTALEQEYEELEDNINSAVKQLSEFVNNDVQIETYFQKIKEAVEHPEKWLMNPQSKASTVKAWGFLFEKPPTWSEMESRTPRLALPFRFLTGSETKKGRLVEVASLESNTLIRHVKAFSKFNQTEFQ
ncbi:recombinase family protein [Hellea balneolensis]|uniref:recombinase family protein n=1 Tax=Hellea balneolensis TaxID=287478 RepID=UPI000413A7B4|nr:recombinase family protein [Hellea balneolensis]